MSQESRGDILRALSPTGSESESGKEHIPLHISLDVLCCIWDKPLAPTTAVRAQEELCIQEKEAGFLLRVLISSFFELCWKTAFQK